MNILFICTSNKDRSPALARYFSAVHPNHNYRSAGVNKYFTNTVHQTHYLTTQDIEWAEVFIFAAEIHKAVVQRDFKGALDNKKYFITLNIEYRSDREEEYLTSAEYMIMQYLN